MTTFVIIFFLPYLHYFLLGLVNQCPGALVKQLKVERKNKANNKNKTFSSFKK